MDGTAINQDDTKRLCYLACVIASFREGQLADENKDVQANKVTNAINENTCAHLVKTFEIVDFITVPFLRMVLLTCLLGKDDEQLVVGFSGPSKKKSALDSWQKGLCGDTRFHGYSYLFSLIDLSYFERFLENKKNKITFSGYKFGGTLASLCTLHFMENTNVSSLVFGSPCLFRYYSSEVPTHNSRFQSVIFRNDPLPLGASISIVTNNFIFDKIVKILLEGSNFPLIEFPEKVDMELIGELTILNSDQKQFQFKKENTNVLIVLVDDPKKFTSPELDSYREHVLISCPKPKPPPLVLKEAFLYTQSCAPGIEDMQVYWMQSSVDKEGTLEIICTGQNITLSKEDIIHFCHDDKKYPTLVKQEKCQVIISAKMTEDVVNDSDNLMLYLHPLYPLLSCSSFDVLSPDKDCAHTQSSIADPLKIFSHSVGRWLLLDGNEQKRELQEKLETNLCELETLLTSKDDFEVNCKDKKGINKAKEMAKQRFKCDAPLCPIRETFDQFRQSKSGDRVIQAVRDVGSLMCLMVVRLNQFGQPINVRTPNAKRKELVATIAYGTAVSLSVISIIALSIITAGAFAPVGVGLAAAQIAIISGSAVGIAASIAGVVSGAMLMSSIFAQFKANYKKKLRMIAFAELNQHNIMSDEEVERIIVEKFLLCEKKLEQEPSLQNFSTKVKGKFGDQLELRKKEILLEVFPDIDGDDLWKYIHAIKCIYYLRLCMAEITIGGIVGSHNSGKSFFLNVAFGLDTKYGLSVDDRTVNPTAYPLNSLPHILLVDFPGSDEIVIHDAQIRFLMQSANCWVIMTTMEKGLSRDYEYTLIAKARQNKIPCVVCLNKADVVWETCESHKHFVKQTIDLLDQYHIYTTVEIWPLIVDPDIGPKAKAILTELNSPDLVKDANAVKRWIGEKLLLKSDYKDHLDQFLQINCGTPYKRKKKLSF